MQIAFLIERNIYYKSFGSVIDEALKRGHKVFCFHDYSQPKDNHQKAYQFPSITDAPSFKNGNVELIQYKNNQELLQKMQQHNIEVLVSLHFSHQHVELRENVKKQGVYWVSLQNSFDTVNFAKYVHLPDRYLVYTNKWIDWIVDYRAKKGVDQPLKETVKPVGFFQLDQKNMINKEEIKAKWNIPKNKKVVLLLPFPSTSTGDSLWAPIIYTRNFSFKNLIKALKNINKFKLSYIKQLIKGQNDKNVILALKKFCDKNNAYLLVKSRKKDLVSKYIENIADKVLYDTEFYPATILKCLSIADLCVHFYSSTITEAIPFDTPCLCIAPFQKDWTSIQGDLWDMLLIKAERMFNFPGASYSLRIPQIIKELPKKIFNDFVLTKQAKQQFTEEFVGNPNQNYSLNVLKEIEALITENIAK